MRSFPDRLALVVLAGVALAAPAAFAQSATSPAAKPATAPAVAPARVPLSIARGTVKSVADSRLVIDLGPPAAGQPPGPSAFVLDGDTQIQRLGRPLAVKDLRAGDLVTVGYVMRGDRALASRVWLRFGNAATAGARPAGVQPR
jgi:hypothetical protein